MARPTLTAIADSLVAAGLARREAEPGDRRVVRLHLTEAGSAAVAAGRRRLRATGSARLLELTGDGDRIRADLRLISTALDELAGRGCAARQSQPVAPFRPGQAP